MIEAYFAEIEVIVQGFPSVRSYALRKKVYNRKQGYIGGTIVFENGYRLDFIEVKDIEVTGRAKYRYQCMDEHQALVFRYDNAPHHKHLQTFPHHKHTLSGVQDSSEPTLYDTLLEIARMGRKSVM